MKYISARSVRTGGTSLCLIFLLFLPAAGVPSLAQAAPAPAFEVATVKPSDAKNPLPPSVNILGDRFEAVGMTLKELIKVAYDLNYGADRQVTGGPSWIASDRFDIIATEDLALAERLQKESSEERGKQLRQMMRDLLAQRFQLKVHHATAELAIYELVQARGGSKLQPVAQAAATPANGAAKTPSWIRFAGKGVLEGNDADTDTLVTALTMQPEIGGRLVVNKTKLPDKYNFTLKWTPDMALGADPSPGEAGPTLFTALQEELGLRLQATKAPVDTIVIDQAELPTAN